MPLPSQYTCYTNFGGRRANVLYNGPIRSGIDYIIGNLRDGRECDEGDRHPSDHLGSKLDGKINENGKLQDGDKSFDSIGYIRMFQILPDRYKEAHWGSVTRIVEHLQ